MPPIRSTPKPGPDSPNVTDHGRPFHNYALCDLLAEIVFPDASHPSQKVVVFGKEYPCPRRQVLLGKGLTYTFSGCTLEGIAFPPLVAEIKAEVEALTGKTFNGCMVNLYPDGKSHIGWHADDERDLKPGSDIASVSFGAARDFDFRHKVHKDRKKRFALTHGQLIVMHDPTQKEWHHSIPKRTKVHAPRLSLTFREYK